MAKKGAPKTGTRIAYLKAEGRKPDEEDESGERDIEGRSRY